MADSTDPRPSYHIGNVGAGARIQQGEYLSWTESTFGGVPGGDELRARFEDLASRLVASPDLDEASTELALEKTQALAEGLEAAPSDPAKLQRSVLDANGWLRGTAAWAWEEIRDI